MSLSEQFEDRLMEAVVRQFFENPPVMGTLPDGTFVQIPSRTTPAQAVAARLLADRNEALLAAIMDAIDLDVFADTIAAKVLEMLKASGNAGYYGIDRSPGAEQRKRLKERVDNRLVELIAQGMYAAMQAAEAGDGEAT